MIVKVIKKLTKKITCPLQKCKSECSKSHKLKRASALINTAPGFLASFLRTSSADPNAASQFPILAWHLPAAIKTSWKKGNMRLSDWFTIVPSPPTHILPVIQD